MKIISKQIKKNKLIDRKLTFVNKTLFFVWMKREKSKRIRY